MKVHIVINIVVNVPVYSIFINSVPKPCYLYLFVGVLKRLKANLEGEWHPTVPWPRYP